MGVRLWMRLFATTLLVLSIQAGTAFADQARPGRLVTLDNKEIVFDSLKNRDLIKGWWNVRSLVHAAVPTADSLVLSSAIWLEISAWRRSRSSWRAGRTFSMATWHGVGD